MGPGLVPGPDLSRSLKGKRLSGPGPAGSDAPPGLHGDRSAAHSGSHSPGFDPGSGPESRAPESVCDFALYCPEQLWLCLKNTDTHVHTLNQISIVLFSDNICKGSVIFFLLFI